MAAIKLTNDQRVYAKQSKLSHWCEGKMKENKVSQKQLAMYLAVTPQNICQRFANESVTISMLIGICSLCDIDPDDLWRALTI